MPDTPKRKRRRTNNFNQIFAREQGMMALEMRKLTVIQQCSELLNEVVELLRAAGVSIQPAQLPIPQVSISQFPQVQPHQAVVPRPCVWCGRQGSPINVGGGVQQDLCPTHAAVIRGQQQADALTAAKGFSVNHTDARPTYAQAQPQGKVVMHPIAADERAAAEHQQIAANGAPTPAGFEEMENGEA